jgi:hypothetical protein
MALLMKLWLDEETMMMNTAMYRLGDLLGLDLANLNCYFINEIEQLCFLVSLLLWYD